MPSKSSDELADLLLELEQSGAKNDDLQLDRHKRMLNLERPTAELINLLLRSTKRNRILEIGTSNGYSALWFARTMRDIGGTPLHTIERDPQKHALARNNFQRAHLDSFIVQHLGEATEIVPHLNVPFDCVFFDADRVSSPSQLQALLPLLSPDVLLLTDNAISHASELEPYLKMVQSLPGFISTTVTVGKGLHIADRSHIHPHP
jgi:predicted O-methyltransferase YrrM